MRFDAQSLTSTANNFRNVLEKRNLAISRMEAHNLWAQILGCKDYLNLFSEAIAQGYITVDINEASLIQSISEIIPSITIDDAIGIIAESIKSDLKLISPLYYEVVNLLETDESLILIPFQRNAKECYIELIKKGKPEYVPIPPDKFTMKGDYQKAETHIKLLKKLATKKNVDSHRDHIASYISEMKDSIKKSDNAFKDLLENNKEEYIKELSPFLFKEVKENLEDADFEFLFETINDLIEDSFNEYRSPYLRWDTPLIGSFVDHVSGSMLRHLNFIKYRNDQEWDSDDAESILTSCVNHYLEITQH